MVKISSMEQRKNNWIVEPDESQCIAMRSHTAIIFCYPFNKEVAKLGPKITTRDGRVVKKVRMGASAGVDVIVGILDGEELKWDAAGRFAGPYEDHPNDLYISERYFMSDWKEHIKMSSAEWAVTYGRPHPGVKIPGR